MRNAEKDLAKFLNRLRFLNTTKTPEHRTKWRKKAITLQRTGRKIESSSDRKRKKQIIRIIVSFHFMVDGISFSVIGYAGVVGDVVLAGIVDVIVVVVVVFIVVDLVYFCSWYYCYC